MKDSKDIVACVIDSGLFLPVATKLAETYKHVYYWSPWDEFCPKLDKGCVGDGFENVERVLNFWKIKKNCDLFISTDICFSGEMQELKDQGYPVWSHGGADVLEWNKGVWLDTLEQCGLNVPKHTIINGMTKLREYLKDKKDKFIKVSRWRGNWETMKWRSFEEDDYTMDQQAFRLGPFKELMKFYVFDPIDADVEGGIDTYCIDGQYPSEVIHGMECKDKSYLCAVQPLDEISPKIREATDKIAPVLRAFQYRSMISSEVRGAGDEWFFIDPTCRFASPPSQVMIELFTNLPDIIWKGANGECIEPEYDDQFGVQALISSKRDSDEWVPINVPDEVRPFIKCGFTTEVDGMLWSPPNELGSMIGWVVATGKTPSEAIAKLKSYRDELPSDLECNVESIASLIKESEAAEEEGIEFPGTMPEPSEVIV